MKYFCRFGKLLFSKEFCKEEDIRLKQLLIVVLSTIGLSCLVFTEFGRQVINVLSVGVCGILIVYCFIFFILHIMTIARKYKEMKKKWKIEEIMNQPMEDEKDEDVTIEEEQQTEEIQSEVDALKQDDEVLTEDVSNEQIEEKEELSEKTPVFFLDLTALERYSGRFYAGYLTECFNFDWITKEMNATLVTDQSILKDLRDMEKDSNNKRIYLGYTAYIMRHFHILPNEDSSNILSNVLKYAEKETVTYVTQNQEFANFMNENGISVKLID